MHYFQKHSILLISIVLFGLSSCGGGNSGSVITANITPLTISGVAADGPIAGGVITVTDANGGLVTTGNTNADGTYNIAIPSAAAMPLQITISGGTDTISNLPQDFPLSTLVVTPTNNISQINANTNALTTLIVASANAEAAASGVPVDAATIRSASTKVMNNIGFGLDPVFDPISTAVTPANAADIIRANEALSELIRRTTVDKVIAENTSIAAAATATNTTATGKVASLIDVQNIIAILAADISDGIMDGYSSSPIALSAATKSIREIEANAKAGEAYSATQSIQTFTQTKQQTTQQITQPLTVAEMQAYSIISQVHTVQLISEVLTNTLQISDVKGSVILNPLASSASLDSAAKAITGLAAGQPALTSISVKNIDASKASNALQRQMAVAVATAKGIVINSDIYSASANISNFTSQLQQLDALQQSVKSLLSVMGQKGQGQATQLIVDSYTAAFSSQKDGYTNALVATRIDAFTAACSKVSSVKVTQQLTASGLPASQQTINLSKQQAVLQTASSIVPQIITLNPAVNVPTPVNVRINSLTAPILVQNTDANAALMQQAIPAIASANSVVNPNGISLASNIATIQDYDVTGVALPLLSAAAPVASGRMNIDLPPLNAGNAKNLATGKATGIKQSLFLPVSNIPPLGSSGQATIQVIVKDDSSNGTAPIAGRLTGERYAKSIFTIDWSVIKNAAGNLQLIITGAQGQAQTTYISASGLSVTLYQTNTAANIFSSQNKLLPNGGVQMNMIITVASLFSSMGSVFPSLTPNMRVAGNYFYTINVGQLPIFDFSGAPFTNVQGTMIFK